MAQQHRLTGRWLLGVGVVACFIPTLACALDSKEIGATAGGSGSDTAMDDASTGEPSDTGVDSDPETSQGTSASTDDGDQGTGSDTGMLETSGDTGMEISSCADASTEGECAAVPAELGNCGWFIVPTFVYNLDQACTDLEIDTGYCFETSVDDGCGVPDPTCPDGETIVYNNSVGLEIGAYEVFSEKAGELTACGPGGSFLPCVFDGETYDPPECECGCPG